MNHLKNIERVYRVINNSVFMTTGKLDYDRVTDAVIKLANMIRDADSDILDDIWYIGECDAASLDTFIVGAFWHYTEWHAGQNSKGYLALSVLGDVFQPGMTYPEDDNEAYIALNEMAA